MKTYKLLNYYWSEHPNAIILLRKGASEWDIAMGGTIAMEITGDIACAMKTALQYGKEVILVQQHNKDGYEEPDIDQIWDDETIGY